MILYQSCSEVVLIYPCNEYLLYLRVVPCYNRSFVNFETWRRMSFVPMSWSQQLACLAGAADFAEHQGCPATAVAECLCYMQTMTTGCNSCLTMANHMIPMYIICVWKWDIPIYLQCNPIYTSTMNGFKGDDYEKILIFWATFKQTRISSRY